VEKIVTNKIACYLESRERYILSSFSCFLDEVFCLGVVLIYSLDYGLKELKALLILHLNILYEAPLKQRRGPS